MSEEMKNAEAELKDTELGAVTGGTEPAELSVPENGLPRPGRGTESEADRPVWTNEKWGAEIPEIPGPGKYELHGVVWEQD